MIRIGITGGIGMGKSAASDYLLRTGIDLIDSDQLARDVVKPGTSALEEIQRHFGPQVLTPSGELDRPALASRIFSNPQERILVESILHPRIRAAWKKGLEDLAAKGRICAAVTIPLLFETEAGREFDRVICVACSKQVQTRRLLSRGMTPEQIAARNQAQWPISQKMELSHFVLWNDGSIDVLHQQMDKVLGTLQVRQIGFNSPA